MPNYTNLKDLFTATADAIRAKTGKTESIVANDFPSEIASISIGFPNGTEWTEAITVNNQVASIVNANGLWVASAGIYIYYSLDGIEWTQCHSIRRINTIVYANGLWLAGHSRGFSYSSDGIVWTDNETIAEEVYTIVNANGIWVAGANTGIYYSEDGKNWTKSNVLGTSPLVFYANGLWCSAGGYSTDGKNWIDNRFYEGNLFSIVNANGLWVASSNVATYYSADGISWTTINDVTHLQYIVNANGLWVASGPNGLYNSKDGKNWTQSNIVDSIALPISYSNGIWICGKYYSYDGITWYSNLSDQYIRSAVYANGLWVAGDKDSILYSIGWQPLHKK